MEEDNAVPQHDLKKVVDIVSNGRLDDLIAELMHFEKNFGSRYTFEELDINRRRELWKHLFARLIQNRSGPSYLCLTALRILSRDKTDLDNLVTAVRLHVLLSHASLTDNVIHKNVNTPCTKANIEALKVLSNVLYNSTKAVQLITATNCQRNVIARMKKYGPQTPTELQYCDCRILFLTTAVDASTRHIVKNELHGDEVLTNLLKSISKQNSSLACLILKVLFNLYNDTHSKELTSTAERTKKQNLFQILNIFLLYYPHDKELYSNTINLLMAILDVSFASLKTESPRYPWEKSCHVFKNVDVEILYNLLEFLKKRLQHEGDMVTNLTPILTVLINVVKSDKVFRKYIRLQILPPLKDVMHRPEEGDSLRAQLCRLLTYPITELRDLVAEFLFLICNQSVSRMVKYTGYGNAAGMFANKGLLAPPRGRPSESSDSEDSDTEEYLKYKELINPVTGCYEKPKPHPLEGMSEEQKEYEALALVNLVDKLTRGGVVQPCRIGEDGKPKPIEHVLQLYEELPKQQFNNKDCSYDSD